MKTFTPILYLILIITLFPVVSNAQTAATKSITFYDLLIIGIPDSTNNSSVFDWNKGMSVHPYTKWKNKTPQLNDIRDKNGKSLGIYYKDGILRNFKLENDKPDECGFHLDGNLKGYSTISISTDVPQNYTLEKLIGNKQAIIILLKKDEDIQGYEYSLKLPGKKEVWFNIFPMDALGDGNKSLEIYCYFNHADLPNN